MSAKKIIFVTGTDTGVGKTLLAALLLHHLRQTDVHALAMKPFCSGGLGDVHLLQSLQRGELSAAEMNPYYFPQPVAPLVAAQGKQKIRLGEVVDRINHVARKCDRLIVEGSGGLLVPLADYFTVADLIAALDCRVIIAARNRLGTINHTLLTINALKTFGITEKNLSVVLMSDAKPDLSASTNLRVIAKILGQIPTFQLPFLGSKASSTQSIRTKYPKVRPTLAKLVVES